MYKHGFPFNIGMRIVIELYIAGVLIVFTSSTLAVTNMQKQAAIEQLSLLINDKKAPGLQYIFVDENNVLFQYQAGLADIKKKIPVTSATTFNAYSVTKTFTAAAVVKLALEHKIDLDKPVDTYIDNLTIKNGPTVRQTLQHMGGFPNPNPLPWIHRADAQFDDQAFVNQVLSEHTRLKFKPGEKSVYSNVGFVVLGELVHQVTGIPYDQYVSAELIKPLMLADDQEISFSIDHPERHAIGYIRKWYWLNLVLGWFIDRDVYLGTSINGWVPFTNFLVNGKAYGGLIGNALGFSRYLQAMLRRQAPFSQEMLDTLFKIGMTNSGESISRGSDWYYGSLNGQRYFMHTGGAGGYYCQIRIYPDAKRASVIMTNNTGISGQHYLDGIDAVLLSRKDGSSR